MLNNDDICLCGEPLNCAGICAEPACVCRPVDHRVTPLTRAEASRETQTLWCPACGPVELDKETLAIFADFDMDADDIGCPDCDHPLQSKPTAEQRYETERQ